MSPQHAGQWLTAQDVMHGKMTALSQSTLMESIRRYRSQIPPNTSRTALVATSDNGEWTLLAAYSIGSQEFSTFLHPTNLWDGNSKRAGAHRADKSRLVERFEHWELYPR